MDLTRTPVLVGIGQVTNRVTNVEADAREPMALMEEAVRAAVADCGAAGVLDAVELVVVSRLLGWYYPDVAQQLAHRVGAHPDRAYESSTGGNTPQKLVTEAANAIAHGDLDVALLCGGEAVASRRKAHRAGVHLPWPRAEAPEYRSAATLTEVSRYEVNHGLYMPTMTFAMIENAMRAQAGEDLNAHRTRISDLMAGFSKVGAANPYAWFTEARTADQFRTVTPTNRMVSFPYTKLMTSLAEVDMAAAVIVCSAAKAKALGIPEDKWVYVWGGATYTEPKVFSERVDYVSSPATRMAGRHACEQAGVSADDIEFCDLYSCFPVAPQMAARELGLTGRPWEALTVTGGLASFGGPWNNYCMHAIVTMADTLRAHPDATGLVHGIGMWMAKISVGVYSARPPVNGTATYDGRRHAEELERISATAPPFTETPDGAATIETYTVWHNRDGAPETGYVFARLQNGTRCLGLVSDAAMLEWMETHEAVGAAGRVRVTEDGRPAFVLTEG